MGFNTAVFILNDLWGRLRDNPEETLYEIDRQMTDYSQRDRSKGHGVEVMSCHHASSTALIAVGGNCFTVVHTSYEKRHHDKESQIELCRDWARELGFDLRKRRQSK